MKFCRIYILQLKILRTWYCVVAPQRKPTKSTKSKYKKYDTTTLRSDGQRYYRWGLARFAFEDRLAFARLLRPKPSVGLRASCTANCKRPPFVCLGPFLLRPFNPAPLVRAWMNYWHHRSSLRIFGVRVANTVCFPQLGRCERVRFRNLTNVGKIWEP